MITPPSQQTRTQTMIPLLAICLGYFMMILDVTIVNVALVDIKEHLSANVTGLQWALLRFGVFWDDAGRYSNQLRVSCVSAFRLRRRACPGLPILDPGSN